MKTQAPQEEMIGMSAIETISMEIPIQKMFDEFLVFVSKSDFE